MIVRERLNLIVQDRTLSQLGEVFKELLADMSPIDREKEHVWTVGLDNRNKVKFIDETHVGGWNAALTEARCALRVCLVGGATSMVNVHNHPSGDVTPSRNDEEAHFRLRKAGDIVGVQLLDSLVVNDKGHVHSIRLGSQHEDLA